MKVDCPFCEGDSCCFCDHTGKVSVGDSEVFKDEKHADNFRGSVDESKLRDLYDNGAFDNLESKVTD